jgi:hypothetical protein
MKYTASATVTISIYTTVEADSPEEAIELAREQPMQNFCAGCTDGEDYRWVTSGELDGEPQDIRVEED